jgi:integrase
LNDSDINREQKYIDITKSAGRRKDKYTREVSIKIGPPKTKHSIRKIPLLPSVEVMLDRQIQLVSEMRKKAGEKWNDNAFVFPTDEGNIHDLSGLRSSMGRILKRAGLPHMTIHALRHTYATTALNAGVAAQNGA